MMPFPPAVGSEPGRDRNVAPFDLWQRESPVRSHIAMAYDQQLADEVRARIGSRSGLTEREMFGGIAFMVNGNMAVGVSGNELMVRVGKEAHDEAVARPGAHDFDMSGRPMRGWLKVGADGLSTDADLQSWIDQGLAHAGDLPPK